jgi:hypothetical protein
MTNTLLGCGYMALIIGAERAPIANTLAYCYLMLFAATEIVNNDKHTRFLRYGTNGEHHKKT